MEPDNRGKKWSKVEETELLQHIENNISIDEIANLHKRTISGIRCRINDIAYNMYLSNGNIDEIKEITDKRLCSI